MFICPGNQTVYLTVPKIVRDSNQPYVTGSGPRAKSYKVPLFRGLEAISLPSGVLPKGPSEKKGSILQYCTLKRAGQELKLLLYTPSNLPPTNGYFDSL